jgi:uncharacterized protein YfaS (alpha-2-macroglobulin family)
MTHFSKLLLILAILVFAAGCKQKASKIAHSPFHARISAFTSGLIPTSGSILVEFTDSVPGSMPGAEAASSLVSISPKLAGKWSWVDHRTLRFFPEERLQPGQKWEVTLHLKKLFPDEKEDFFFYFGTLPQNYRVNVDPLKPAGDDDFSSYTQAGKVVLADDAENEAVESMLEADLNGNSVPIIWSHSDGKTHLFEIGPLARTDKAGKLEINHTGKPVSVDEKGEISITIPAINDFSVQSVQVIQHPRQLVRLTFSDPLRPDQDLDGLVFIKGSERSPYMLNQNILEIFPTGQLYGDREVVVLPGILNTRGNVIAETHTHYIHFASMKPAVEIIGNGNIIPFSDGLMLHFKAVALKGVLVRIIKIYENNVPYFLQVNSLDEDSQLKRAGRLVHKSVVSIENDATLDLNQWNTFALELSQLIQPDPGAIYRIELGFDQSLSAYPCAEGELDVATTSAKNTSFEDGEFWDDPDNYYSSYPYYYDEDWDWENRDNPCSSSYYTRSRWVARNLLASNLGIIAKGGTAGVYHTYVTDLRTTEPISDVTLELLNFQMQPLVSAKTNSDGIAVLNTKEKPFLLIAKKDKQKGYLRMDDGRMMPLSRFDVSGQTVPKGIKGYIYGERGVWRPGDSIFISFIPEDKYQKLPANHPVTFELVNPRGQLTYRQVARHPQNRIYAFRTATTEDAVTGFWLARIMVGDALFEQTIRIETIKPNRLRINLDFGKAMLEGSKPISGQLTAEWLHGAVAANLKAKVALVLQPGKTVFKGYNDFNFDNAARLFEPAEEIVFDGTLNAQGKTSISFQSQLQQRAPGMLKATFTTRVFEEGGSFSIDRMEMPLLPYSNYVGLRPPKGDQNGLLLTDIDHNIEIATVNAAGQPVSISNLEYKIYKINWRWWWERTEEDLGNFVSTESENLILSGTTRTSNGKGAFNFRINKPDWGRYLIEVYDPQGGHSTTATVLIDWPGWAQKPGGADADAATMLVFAADKESYKVGETATINFPSSPDGRALVSIENGSTIVESWWVKPSSGSTKVTFKVTEAMTPNVYVHISLLQPHNQTANDLPIRMYGIIPLMVHSPSSILTPVLKTTEEWRPQETAMVQVSEKSGQAMSYTLAIVDEGLLDLTRFRTPNPWNHFNAREALGVKTWDLYDQVLGAYGGRIERLFSIGGGDEIIGAKSDAKARRFEPMVRFLGPFDLKKGGSNKHAIAVPNYVGSVRVMVVGAYEKASGSAEVAVPIRKPLMVWSGLPRVLSPGETVLLPVTIFASGKALGSINITANAGNNLSITGSNSQTITISEDGEKTIFFEMKAGNLTGISKVEVLAQAGGEKASHIINLPVRNPNPSVTNVVSAIIPAGGKSQLNYQLVGIKGTNKSTLEISVIPPMDFGRRLHYLLDYPHGCIEQITSGGFPQIFLPEMVQLDPATVSRTKSNVQSVISRLASYQTSNGGFAYWPGGSTAEPWANNYAGHFMIEAEKKGYAIPNQLKRNWLNYQKSASASWLPDRSGQEYAHDFIQAYRLFTLALADEADMSGMNRLRQQPTLSPQAKWRLAAAYALAGMGEIAKEMTETIPSGIPNKASYCQTYGSDERDMAMVLETHVLLGQKEQAARLALLVAKKLNSSEWMSTQTTAYCLMAMSRYAAGEKVTSGDVKIRYQINGAAAESVAFSVPLLQKEVNLESQEKWTVTVENKSSAQVFANLILKGQPLRDTTQEAFSSGLVMRILYSDLQNNPIDVSALGQGTDFKTIITLYNPGTTTISNLAVTQIFASGWEIRNTRFEESGAVHELDQPEYRDIRDDRVYSYLDLKPGESKRLVTVLHASYAGRFYLPPVVCEAMYDYSIRAKTLGQWVEVKR